ncbi:unnamed protein product [Adineta steineri]|uniref:Uncharacterized protein n=1 Tax=Adineta steineri TaxID=433720 RepID=A0A814IAF0_9BILA|nr:unnamed protein product [Adineta steineri]CAF3716492.1 unnamed protein product [Adineta steineri]
MASNLMQFFFMSARIGQVNGIRTFATQSPKTSRHNNPSGSHGDNSSLSQKTGAYENNSGSKNSSSFGKQEQSNDSQDASIGKTGSEDHKSDVDTVKRN